MKDFFVPVDALANDSTTLSSIIVPHSLLALKGPSFPESISSHSLPRQASDSN